MVKRFFRRSSASSTSSNNNMPSFPQSPQSAYAPSSYAESSASSSGRRSRSQAPPSSFMQGWTRRSSRSSSRSSSRREDSRERGDRSDQRDRTRERERHRSGNSQALSQSSSRTASPPPEQHASQRQGGQMPPSPPPSTRYSPSVGTRSDYAPSNAPNSPPQVHRAAPYAQSASGQTITASAYAASNGVASHRAPSVASTTAARQTQSGSSHRSRARHSSQSVAELPTSIPEEKNDFPWFGKNGEVEIVIKDKRGRREKRYLLHRFILSRCSGWFEGDLQHCAFGTGADNRTDEQDLPGSAATSTVNNPTLAGNTRSKRRWRYELNWDAFDASSETLPMLVQTDPRTSMIQETPPRPTIQTRNKPSSSSGGFRNGSGSSNQATDAQKLDDEDLFSAYESLLLTFYNHPPALSTSSIALAYLSSKRLLYLASAYTALSTVGPRVDHHLLRFGPALWKQVARYPPSYLKLAYLCRSRQMLQESLVHVVGAWPAGAPLLKHAETEPRLMDLVEDKVDELAEQRTKIEGKLFRLTLTTGRGERVSPSNSYLDWLMVSFWRQWVTDHLTAPPASILKDGGGRAKSTSQNVAYAVHLLHAAGQAYLPHEECKRFLKLSREYYSRDNLRRFERRLDELKNLARETIRPLTRNFLAWDAGALGDGGAGVPYLTCCRVEERDFEFIWAA